MMTCHGGPANNVILAIRRSPILLRVVFNPRKKKEPWDALDQPDDVAEPWEQIFLYRLAGKPTAMHIRASRGLGGFYPCGEYLYLEEQPEQQILRSNAMYSSWFETNIDRLMPDWARLAPTSAVECPGTSRSTEGSARARQDDRHPQVAHDQSCSVPAAKASAHRPPDDQGRPP